MLDKETYDQFQEVLVNWCNAALSNCCTCKEDYKDTDWIGTFLSYKNGILRRYTNFCKEYKPLTDDMFLDVMNEMCNRGIFTKIYDDQYSNTRFLLNEKYSKPIPKYEVGWKEYETKFLSKPEIESKLEELNKLSLEEKLQHPILVDTLDSVFEYAFLNSDVYNYCDLIALSKYQLSRLYRISTVKLGKLQRHLHELSLEFNSFKPEYEKYLSKNNKDTKLITDILEMLMGYKNSNNIPNDKIVKALSKEGYTTKYDHWSSIRGIFVNIQKFALEKYFIIDSYQIGTRDNKLLININKIDGDDTYEKLYFYIKVVKNDLYKNITMNMEVDINKLNMTMRAKNVLGRYYR